MAWKEKIIMHEKRMLVCPVCGTEKWTVPYKISQWEIGECVACGFARIDPLPTTEGREEQFTEEKIHKRNTKKRTLLRRLLRDLKQLFSKITHRTKHGIFCQKLSRYLVSNAKVLDIGCGDGGALHTAKDKFICTGIDISAYQADLVKKQGYAKSIAGNFLTVDFGNEKYDGITLISLLEHLDDPKTALETCYRLLNNNGVLLLKSVNYSCLNRRVRSKKWTGFRPPDHVVYFSPSNLKKLLKKIGFTKIKISAWPFADNMYCDAWK